MSFILKLSNGKTEVDFISSSYKLTEGGLRLPPARYKTVAPQPLVGVHGQRYGSVEYQNRSVEVSFSVYGSTYSILMGNVNTLSKLIHEANNGGKVDLIIQAQDSNNSYLRVLSGQFKLPDQIFSLEGVHWKDGSNYVLHNNSITIETAPFFTDYPSYEREGDVVRDYDGTVDNGETISLTDIAGDMTTETILEFVGAYSNGTQKIYIGNGAHSLVTNLTAGIDDSVLSMVVDEDYSGRVLVPFIVTIGTEELRVTNVEDGTWTMTRAYDGSSAASHSLGNAVTMSTRYDLNADSALSYCDTSNMRTGLVNSMSLAGGGTGYVVNQIVTLTGQGNADCKIRVLSVASGAIVTWEITDGGSGYTDSDTGVTCTAVGATFDIDAITSVEEAGGATGVNSSGGGGTGYSDGDVLTLTAGNGDCTVTVTSETAGMVDDLDITTAGTGYIVADDYVTTSPDGGTGCTIDINTIATNVSTTDDLDSKYMTIKVSGQGIHDLVEWDLDREYVSVINQRCRVVGKEAQTGSGWNTSINYRVKIGYRSIEDDSFIELDKTDWKTPNAQTDALFDFGSAMIPPSGSNISAPSLSIILQVQIKPDDAYDSSLDIVEYSLDIDFLKLIPVGNGFRYINCGTVPFFILDKLIDDSRMAAPYVQEVNGAEFAGEVVVDGIMPPIRLMPTNAGSSLTFLFEDGGGTASMAMDLDTEVGIIGNYLGLVD